MEDPGTAAALKEVVAVSDLEHNRYVFHYGNIEMTSLHAFGVLRSHEPQCRFVIYYPEVLLVVSK